MKLELKHLSAYLPYGVRVLRPDLKTILDVKGVIGNLIVFNENGLETYGSIFYSKLILRPMSDLNKEIDHNGERLVPMEKVREAFGSVDFRNIDFDPFSIFNCNYSSEFPEKVDITFAEIYGIFQLLLSWHFDIFNIIPSGLAVDANEIK